MDDLIKREDAIKAVERVCNGDNRCLSFIEFINTIPSAERKGEWETVGKTHPYARCSLCGRVRASYSSRFCDWCGAKMKGAEDE